MIKKILFLDCDGVVNSKNTTQRSKGFIGIDPELAFRAGKIPIHTGCEVVLSSTWRLMADSRDEIKQRVYPFVDITPQLPGKTRGEEIQAWLDIHPEVTKYAILDDDADMLESQLPNFFRTSWENGLTEEIMERVIDHLNG